MHYNSNLLFVPELFDYVIYFIIFSKLVSILKLCQLLKPLLSAHNKYLSIAHIKTQLPLSPYQAAHTFTNRRRIWHRVILICGHRDAFLKKITIQVIVTT